MADADGAVVDEDMYKDKNETEAMALVGLVLQRKTQSRLPIARRRKTEAS
jgi:hypothetical protein